MLRRATRSFGPALTDVREARGFSNQTTRSWGVPSEVAELVVSELAANAVVHAGSGFTVALADDAGTLRIEVQDDGRGAPAIPHAGIDATHGRGLLLVERLAGSWGCREEPGGGKTVWVELGHARLVAGARPGAVSARR
jgi:anti-sigma regulatory factor (Ser/Thr protein kinase)